MTELVALEVDFADTSDDVQFPVLLPEDRKLTRAQVVILYDEDRNSCLGVAASSEDAVGWVVPIWSTWQPGSQEITFVNSAPGSEGVSRVAQFGSRIGALLHNFVPHPA